MGEISGSYAPFLVSITEHNDVRYSVECFSDFFDIQSTPPEALNHTTPTPSDPTSVQQNEDTEGRFSAHNNTYINKEYTLSIIMGTYPPNPQDQGESIRVDTMDEAVDYICRQDIVTFYRSDQKCRLDKGTTTTCPFHRDSTPSASIHYHEEYCYLTCHSDHCSFGSGTLIKVVQKRESLTEGEAVKKLMKHFNIILDESWKDAEKKKIEENLEILKGIDLWKEQYPYLYRWVSRIIWDLRSKLIYALGHMGLRISQGKGIFFCSLKHFEKIYRRKEKVRSQNNQNQRVDRYCLLGLMEKINDSDIPCGVYRKTQKIKSDRRLLYRIQYYHIPAYTPELLEKANETARMGQEKGIRLNAITKNSMRDIYGEEVAQRIYPQTDDFAISESTNCLLHSIEQVVGQEKLFRTKFGYRKWRKICLEAGLADLKFHDLRKTFCSLLAQNGVSTAVTQRLLEHSSPNLTNKIICRPFSQIGYH